MPRVFVGNFDFEHELAAGPRKLSRDVQYLAADLVSAWLAIAEPDDLIWSPTGLPAFDFSDLRREELSLPRFISQASELPQGPQWELVPWGWTAALVTQARSQGWTCSTPPIDSVRRVNSRIFRWQLEHELGVELPGSTIVRSIEQLRSHVTEHVAEGAGWVVKANFGMAGRERSLGRGPSISEPVLNWARKRLAQSEGLVFEPWVERIAEAGIQWQIPPAGEPELIGVTPLLTDLAGTYRGSRIAAPTSEMKAWDAAVTTTREVARRVQHAGYWGPLGVDAMQYRTAQGEHLCRPLQDLNARYTMGRLALGWNRLVPDGRTAHWLHDSELVGATTANEPQAKIIQTTARSWLVIGGRCE